MWNSCSENKQGTVQEQKYYPSTEINQAYSQRIDRFNQNRAAQEKIFSNFQDEELDQFDEQDTAQTQSYNHHSVRADKLYLSQLRAKEDNIFLQSRVSQAAGRGDPPNFDQQSGNQEEIQQQNLQLQRQLQQQQETLKQLQSQISQLRQKENSLQVSINDNQADQNRMNFSQSGDNSTIQLKQQIFNQQMLIDQQKRKIDESSRQKVDKKSSGLADPNSLLGKIKSLERENLTLRQELNSKSTLVQENFKQQNQVVALEEQLLVSQLQVKDQKELIVRLLNQQKVAEDMNAALNAKLYDMEMKAQQSNSGSLSKSTFEKGQLEKQLSEQREQIILLADDVMKLTEENCALKKEIHEKYVAVKTDELDKKVMESLVRSQVSKDYQADVADFQSQLLGRDNQIKALRSELENETQMNQLLKSKVDTQSEYAKKQDENLQRSRLIAQSALIQASDRMVVSVLKDESILLDEQTLMNAPREEVIQKSQKLLLYVKQLVANNQDLANQVEHQLDLISQKDEKIAEMDKEGKLHSGVVYLAQDAEAVKAVLDNIRVELSLRSVDPRVELLENAQELAAQLRELFHKLKDETLVTKSQLIQAQRLQEVNVPVVDELQRFSSFKYSPSKSQANDVSLTQSVLKQESKEQSFAKPDQPRVSFMFSDKQSKQQDRSFQKQHSPVQRASLPQKVYSNQFENDYSQMNGPSVSFMPKIDVTFASQHEASSKYPQEKSNISKSEALNQQQQNVVISQIAADDNSVISVQDLHKDATVELLEGELNKPRSPGRRDKSGANSVATSQSTRASRLAELKKARDSAKHSQISKDDYSKVSRQDQLSLQVNEKDFTSGFENDHSNAGQAVSKSQFARSPKQGERSRKSTANEFDEPGQASFSGAGKKSVAGLESGISQDKTDQQKSLSNQLVGSQAAPEQDSARKSASRSRPSESANKNQQQNVDDSAVSKLSKHASAKKSASKSGLNELANTEQGDNAADVVAQSTQRSGSKSRLSESKQEQSRAGDDLNFLDSDLSKGVSQHGSRAGSRKSLKSPRKSGAFSQPETENLRTALLGFIAENEEVAVENSSFPSLSLLRNALTVFNSAARERSREVFPSALQLQRFAADLICDPMVFFPLIIELFSIETFESATFAQQTQAIQQVDAALLARCCRNYLINNWNSQVNVHFLQKLDQLIQSDDSLGNALFGFSSKVKIINSVQLLDARQPTGHQFLQLIVCLFVRGYHIPVVELTDEEGGPVHDNENIGAYFLGLEPGHTAFTFMVPLVNEAGSAIKVVVMNQ